MKEFLEETFTLNFIYLFLKRNEVIKSAQSTEHLRRSCYHLLVCTPWPGTFRLASYPALRITGVGHRVREVSYLAPAHASCKGQGQNLNLGLSLSKLRARAHHCVSPAGGVSYVLRSRAA